MKAWITTETIDAEGKRTRKTAEPGTRGVEKTARFVVEWIDPAGRRKRHKIPGAGKHAKESAERRAREITTAIEHGTYENKNLATWSDFRRQYEQQALTALAPSTRGLTLNALDAFERIIKPIRMTAIDSQTIDRFTTTRRAETRVRDKRSDVKQPVSPANVNKELRHIKAALRKALKWEFLTKLPDIAFLKEPRRLPTFVSTEDFGAIYQACDAAIRPEIPNVSPADWWRALFVTANMTGWRIGQLLALTWADVDLEAATAVVRADVEGNKGKRDERVKLHPIVVEHLRKVQGFGSHLFAWDYHERTLYADFYRIQKAAGVKPDGRRVYGFHDFRRAFATMNAGDMDPSSLQLLMQHKSYQTTMRYINMGRKLDEVVAKLHVPDVLRIRSAN